MFALLQSSLVSALIRSHIRMSHLNIKFHLLFPPTFTQLPALNRLEEAVQSMSGLHALILFSSISESSKLVPIVRLF